MPFKISDVELVIAVKKDIWDGLTTYAVAAKHGLSQPSVWQVKSGYSYPEVPWPDGSTGELAPARVVEIKRIRKDKRKNANRIGLNEAQEAYRQAAATAPRLSPKVSAKEMSNRMLAWFGAFDLAIEGDDLEQVKMIALAGEPEWDFPDYVRRFCARFGIDDLDKFVTAAKQQREPEEKP